MDQLELQLQTLAAQMEVQLHRTPLLVSAAPGSDFNTVFFTVVQELQRRQEAATALPAAVR